MAEMDRAECLRRLAQAGVGRVSTTVAALPTIFPVDYAMLDDDIVFRTAAGTTLADAVQDAVVAFEIDDIDPWSTTGWSIVVVGHAARSPGQTRSPAPSVSRSTAGSTVGRGDRPPDLHRGHQGTDLRRAGGRAGLNAGRITDLRP